MDNMEKYQALLYSSDFAVQMNHPLVVKDDRATVCKVEQEPKGHSGINAEQLVVDMSRSREMADWKDLVGRIDDLTQDLNDALGLLLADFDYWEEPRSNRAVAARMLARNLNALDDYFAGGFDGPPPKEPGFKLGGSGGEILGNGGYHPDGGYCDDLPDGCEWCDDDDDDDDDDWPIT